ALPRREDPRDAIATITGGDLDSLPDGARIGTSSLRRMAQLKAKYPSFEFISIRGNIQTRLSKLGEEVDVVILAAAGVCRMGMQDKMHQFMDTGLMLPAVAQGTLGIQTRNGDDMVNALVDQLNDHETIVCTTAERAFLARLEGGCQVPIAAFATLDGDQLLLKGLVGDVDGSDVIAREVQGLASDAEQMGITLADEILDAGARPILEELYAAQ
ncbi:MAG: hydroxymethylbilane synthase, partial [Mariprofundaceae bacterium]